MHGAVRVADGREWCFDDPCLTTWEARRLGTWLRAVLTGEVRPTELGDDAQHLISFTEPNVAISLASKDSSSASLRFHFSLESAPPWTPADGSVDTSGYVVHVTAALGDLTAAIEEWVREIAAFPDR